MNEKPLERLNFFNGQRLQADDLRVEQDYHMRVRRWLNRSLYTSGIADGLDVHKVPNAPKVRVGPGLALDNFGRELIHLEMRELVVPGTLDHEGKPTDKNKPVGLYLTVRYGESLTSREDGVCAGPDRPAVGGPSRVLAEPVFEWSANLPHEESGKVLLAFLGLGKGCKEVSLLDLAVRRYVGAASAAKVRQYALEGTREIDSSNHARILFHIRGRQPTSVTLYIRSEPFPSFFYTELGRHEHALALELTPHSIAPHGHSLEGVSSMTDAESNAGVTHAHEFLANTGGWFNGVNPASGKRGPDGAVRADAFAMTGRDGDPNGPANGSGGVFQRHSHTNLSVDGSLGPVASISGGAHRHSFGVGQVTKDDRQAPLQLTHSLTAASENLDRGTGLAPAARTSGASLSHVRALEVRFDDLRVITPFILDQIRANSTLPDQWNGVLGDGTGSHPFAATGLGAGTGAIRIDQIPGVVLGPGEHSIDLSVVGVGNGGRIHFNLYIE